MSTILKEKVCEICYTAARNMATKPKELRVWMLLAEEDKSRWVKWYDDILKGHIKCRRSIFMKNFLSVAQAFEEVMNSYSYMKPQVSNLGIGRAPDSVTLFDTGIDKKKYEQALARISRIKQTRK